MKIKGWEGGELSEDPVNKFLRKGVDANAILRAAGIDPNDMRDVPDDVIDEAFAQALARDLETLKRIFPPGSQVDYLTNKNKK